MRTSLLVDVCSRKTLHLGGFVVANRGYNISPCFGVKMSYRFSGVTQKLTGSSPMAAYNPQGLKPGLPAEPPTMIFTTPTKLVSEAGSTVDYLGSNRVPELQRVFQASKGVPVHLKRGIPDKLLYRTTMALTVGGTLYCLYSLYLASQPKKN